MRPRSILSTGNFLFGIQTTLVLYILFPYLSTFLPEAQTGLVVSAGALMACAMFFLLPRLVHIIGPQRLAITAAIIEGILLLMLAIAPNAYAAAIFAALMVAFQPILAFQMDILLEATMEQEGSTGRVRALFITAWSLAAILAPLLIGVLLADSEAYDRVFLAGAMLSLPFAALFAFRKLPTDGEPKLAQMRHTLACLVRDRDLAAVAVGHQILYFFFVWGPFYIPLYLHSALDIPWTTLGWMFTVMLIPYVLIEYPTGWIADKRLGDKELMIVGFLISGIAFGSLAFMTKETSLMVILGVLIATRIGAALVESTTEGHFFRRVSERDINSVSVFRAAWPIGDLIAPLIGSALLFAGDFYLLFIVTGGIIAIGGAVSALFIRDFEPRPRIPAPERTYSTASM